MKKRYHICWHGIFGKWQCYDAVMNIFGYGATVRSAVNNCQFELEMATSDMHK